MLIRNRREPADRISTELSAPNAAVRLEQTGRDYVMTEFTGGTRVRRVPGRAVGAPRRGPTGGCW